MKNLLRYWLPLISWMMLIFIASADAESTRHTSRFLVPFLRWLNPHVTPAQIEVARWSVRKAAHMTEFAIMAWLTWRALHKTCRGDDGPWSWKIGTVALALCVVYAASDEIHQRFVRNRTASLTDVCVDTAGAAIGLALVRTFYRPRERQK